MKTVSAAALKEKLDNGETLVLLDVRENWEYELCNIPGSVNISMSNTDRMLHELKKDVETVVICHHGMRSFQVLSYLQSCGFTQITNLEGGIDNWAKTIAADMATY